MSRLDTAEIIRLAKEGKGGADDWRALSRVIGEDSETALAMVSRGVGVSCPELTPPGQTAPLIETVRHKNRALVGLLLQKGASPQARSGVLTPLGMAMGTKQTELVELLLDAGGEPSAEDFQRESWLSDLGLGA